MAIAMTITEPIAASVRVFDSLSVIVISPAMNVITAAVASIL